ncbi:hypothetical protein [uncultured Microbulbifer sp.]|uniref:hypothetical protein n=1 Tax=uncultured Microbulbifer sp. TaxID=348147 RepID=UPI00261C9988|nr:hypothetical protein [uncultured Microbulbifer sp.]
MEPKDKTGAERARRYRERQGKHGLKKVALWIRPEYEANARRAEKRWQKPKDGK